MYKSCKLLHVLGWASAPLMNSSLLRSQTYGYSNSYSHCSKVCKVVCKGTRGWRQGGAERGGGVAKPGADPGFFLGGGAPLMNDVTDR